MCLSVRTSSREYANINTSSKKFGTLSNPKLKFERRTAQARSQAHARGPALALNVRCTTLLHHLRFPSENGGSGARPTTARESDSYPRAVPRRRSSSSSESESESDSSPSSPSSSSNTDYYQLVRFRTEYLIIILPSTT